MTKCLHIVNRLNVGGITQNICYLCKHVNNVDSFVLAGVKEPYEGSSEFMLIENGIPYQVLKSMKRSMNPFLDILSLIRVIDFINEYKPDVIHTHAAKAGYIGRLASLLAKHKANVVVHTYHGNVFEGYFNPLFTRIIQFIERGLANITNVIISLSDTQKDDLVNKYKICEKSKVVVVPLGMEFDSFQTNIESKSKEIRSELGISDEIVLISIIGRVTEIKNHYLLIDSLVELRKYEMPKYKILIVGDGELKDSVDAYASSKNFKISHFYGSNTNIVDADIFFLSWRKDIDKIIAASDIVALTSKNEGTPVSIIEAMSAGKAVISTKVGGISDFVIDGINGVLSSINANEFGFKLSTLIKDRSYRLRLGSKAANDVLEKFSYKQMVKLIDTIYHKKIQSL